MSRPWYPFYFGDYLGDTRRLSMLEHGAYLLLMAEYYQHGGLPANAEQMHRVCMAFADAEKVAIDKVLAMHFVYQDGRYTHTRIDKELDKARQISEKRAKAAKTRYEKRPANAPANAYANAPAIAEQMHTQPQPQPHSNNKSSPMSPLLVDNLSTTQQKRFQMHENWLPNEEALQDRLSAIGVSAMQVTESIDIETLHNFVTTQDPELELTEDRWTIRYAQALKDRIEKPKRKNATRFVKPSVHEVASYCDERNNNIDPESFIDHYNSNGWKVGTNKTPMKCWKSAVRQWERRNKQHEARQRTAKQNTIIDHKDQTWSERFDA